MVGRPGNEANLELFDQINEGANTKHEHVDMLSKIYLTLHVMYATKTTKRL